MAIDDPHNGARRAWRAWHWRLAAWGAAALLWLAPAVAMRFTAEVDWSPFDFVVFGALLLAAGGALELAVRLTRDGAYRAGIGVAVGAAFVLVWVNGAVGVIGGEDHPANVLLLGVPAVALIGALAARGRPGGMARALVTTAAAQALVGAVGASLFGAASGRTLVATGVFMALWLLSAGLFRRSAGKPGQRAGVRA